ncbi:MAG: peptidase M14, partial [Wenzhouxiangellaceae bacterium]|nr:peptidase M14 [Wenzhouxiangellaceae bacterium]
PPGSVSGPEDAVAWLAPGGSRATTRLLAGALRGGLSVQSSEEAFTHEGREYPRGTLIVPASGNGEDVVSRLQALAEETGAEVVGAGESWVTAGPDFGSRSAPRIVAPRIALAWDTPTDIYAPGATRFVIEREIGYPVIPIRTSTLKDADLNRFDVLILPDASERFGGYSEILGDEGRDHLADWVDGGGVLVTMAGATEWASHPDVDLLAIRAEHQVRDEDDEEVESKEGDSGPDEDAPVAGRVPGIRIESAAEFQRVVQPERENPDPVAGVLVRAESDPDHWLTAGVAGSVQVLVRGDRVFRPMPREAGRDVVRFAGPEDLLAAGLLWDENRAQLAYKPFVVHQPRGRGMVIGFTEDPTVRAYLDGLNTLLANAVLRAPTYSERLR